MKEFIKFSHQCIKQNAFMLFSGIGFILFFLMTVKLYGLPLMVVVYPGCVYLLFMIFSCILKCSFEYNRHKKIIQIVNSIPEFPDKSFFKGPIEKDYEEVCRSFKDFVYTIQTENINRLNNMNDYYSIWVHQIKTPIASMRLALQAEDTDFSRKMLLELKRIEQYVEMVLTFLRLESKDSDYVVKEADLDELLRASIRKFSTDFINKKLRLEFEPTNRKVVTDVKWFGFVFEQILSNSLKYTPQGGISIYVDEKENLCIKDTGIGISQEDLPRIFENGYTGINGRLDNQSTGIGLYLCKRILSNLNHSISITSEPDKGTTVSIGLIRSLDRVE